MKMHKSPLKFLLIIFLLPAAAPAGPPFLTDDPEPVDFRHWEFYVASEQQIHRSDAEATLPHFEINYGVVPDIQLHVVLPLSYIHSGIVRMYGYSDTEMGVKFRFIEESESAPQIGVFPLVELPTGNEKDLLGNGKTQAYLPVWIQKSWGKLTTYGGAGYWINPGDGNKNWIFAGWEAQYDLSESLTLGGELYYHSADAVDSQQNEGFNAGGFINVTENHHILFSCGSTFGAEKIFTGYLGYQLTI